MSDGKRLDLPGNYYLISDYNGEWYIAEPTGIWIGKFWDGPQASAEDAALFAKAMKQSKFDEAGDIPLFGSLVERLARAFARSEGLYLDGGGIYTNPDAQWRDHWEWYLTVRDKGGIYNNSYQARWEKQARIAIDALKEIMATSP